MFSVALVIGSRLFFQSLKLNSSEKRDMFMSNPAQIFVLEQTAGSGSCCEILEVPQTLVPEELGPKDESFRKTSRLLSPTAAGLSSSCSCASHLQEPHASLDGPCPLHFEETSPLCAE